MICRIWLKESVSNQFCVCIAVHRMEDKFENIWVMITFLFKKIITRESKLLCFDYRQNTEKCCLSLAPRCYIQSVLHMLNYNQSLLVTLRGYKNCTNKFSILVWNSVWPAAIIHAYTYMTKGNLPVLAFTFINYYCLTSSPYTIMTETQQEYLEEYLEKTLNSVFK